MKELKVYGMNDPKVGDEYEMYKVSEVDAVLAEKDKEIAELKEQYKDMDVTHTVHIAKMNAKIEELEDNVDFCKKENRKLKRALYKACASWARTAAKSFWNRWEDVNFRKWQKVKRKCREKAEEYR